MVGWLEGWEYRKRYVLQRDTEFSSFAMYRLDIEYLADKMNVDLSDVRFTADDGTTLVTYVQFDQTPVDPSGEWVSGGVTGAGGPVYQGDVWYVVFYMYYGKSDALFPPICEVGDYDLLCDDFVTGTIDVSKWETVGTITEEIGEGYHYVQSKYPYGVGHSGLNSILSFSAGREMIMRVAFDPGISNRYSSYGFFSNKDASGSFIRLRYRGADGLWTAAISDGVGLDEVTITDKREQVFFAVVFKWNADGTGDVLIDGKSVISSALIITGSMYAVGRLSHLAGFLAVDIYDKIDYLGVRAIAETIDEDDPDVDIELGPEEEPYEEPATCYPASKVLYQIRHSVNIVDQRKEFPNELMLEWIYDDLLETILRLGGVLNHRYLGVAHVVASGTVATLGTSITKSVSGVLLEGFSGLTINAFSGGAAIVVVDDIRYYARITSNTETTVTIKVATDLPSLVGASVILSVNTTGGTISFEDVGILEYEEPIVQVRGPEGVDIDKMYADQAAGINNISAFDDMVYYYKYDGGLRVVLGFGATWSGVIELITYLRPKDITALTSCVWLPCSWRRMLVEKTAARMLRKIGKDPEAHRLLAKRERYLKFLEKRSVEAGTNPKNDGEIKN